MLTDLQREQLEGWIDADPVFVALKSGSTALAQAVEALRKAKNKVPAYFEARCEMKPIMVEQATSEAVATSREFPFGDLAIDLTCGMGVDSWALSRNFKRVVAIEIDPTKVELTRENFKRLGVSNVEIVCTSAELFLEQFDGVADLIFCDPSRRTENGKRLYNLIDCAPNIVDLMGVMTGKAKRVAVKLSPLFDVDELFKIFPKSGVEVISHNGECKEVVLHVGKGVKEGIISNTIIKSNETYRFDFKRDTVSHSQIVENPKFIYQPDVAFYKSRTVESYIKMAFENTKFHFSSYLFVEIELENFVGRTWKIKQIVDYKPKAIKALLKERDITSATIIHRNFPQSTELICKQLGIKEGGSQELIFCKLNGGFVVVFV